MTASTRKKMGIRIPTGVFLLCSLLFLGSCSISVVHGIALFGKKEGGNYFVWQGRRNHGGRWVEVSRTTFLVCKTANWITTGFLAAGLLIWLRIAADNKSEPKFIPNPHNGKEVVVRGWTADELTQIMNDFRGMYKTRLGQNFSLKVHPVDGGAIRVTFPCDIPALMFLFFVNYVQYPKNFDLKARPIAVFGKARLSADFGIPDSSLNGRNAVFYVPSKGQDYDLVYVQVDDQTFEASFAFDKWKKVSDPRIPSGLRSLI